MRVSVACTGSWQLVAERVAHMAAPLGCEIDIDDGRGLVRGPAGHTVEIEVDQLPLPPELQPKLSGPLL